MAKNISDYKKRNKPKMNENSKFYQGYFIPKHPEKCLTKENICRSGWEFKFCNWLDNNANVIEWGSEPLAIPYKNPIANLKYCKENCLNPQDPVNWKICNYYVDFWFRLRQADGTVKRIFVEIKPYSQCQPPKPLKPNAKLKDVRAYNKAAETWLVNSAKWKAAKQICESKGSEFWIVTEKTLGNLGLL